MVIINGNLNEAVIVTGNNNFVAKLSATGNVIVTGSENVIEEEKAENIACNSKNTVIE